MHGQVKTDKTAAAKEKESKQKAAKLKIYREGMSEIFERRKANIKDWETMNCIGNVLSVNPEIVTLWNIRKETLLHMIEQNSLDDPLKVGESELKLTETCLKVNPKAYGAWHHRCWIVEHFPQLNLKLELELCNKYLKLDSRNFHCWDYRRFITAKLGLSPEEELAYTMKKIEEDFSNYSSWHYRSKLLPLIHSDPAGIRPIKEEIHLQELDLVQNAAFTDPNDQSAWFYLRWLLGRSDPKLEVVLAFLDEVSRKLYVGFNRDTRDVRIDCSGSGKWETVSGEVAGSLWVSIIEEVADELVFNVTLGEENVQILLTKLEQFSWFKVPQFESDISPNLKAVFNEQLDSCNQLLDLEPGSKWPLLTSVVLMKAIDAAAFREEILKRLRLLTEEDPLRSAYYADTMSRFLLERTLETLQPASLYSLKGLGLTTLHHSQYLSLVKHLDLSNNRLQPSLHKLAPIVNCETLSLNENELTSLRTLPALPKVRTLSLANNKLKTCEEIAETLAKLPSLQQITLTNNPIADDTAALVALQQHIKSAKLSIELITN